MIVLNKKRVLLSLVIVFLAIFSFVIGNEIIDSSNVTTETVALPVSNKVIVIDARTSEYQMKVHRAVAVQQRLRLI